MEKEKNPSFNQREVNLLPLSISCFQLLNLISENGGSLADNLAIHKRGTSIHIAIFIISRQNLVVMVIVQNNFKHFIRSLVHKKIVRLRVANSENSTSSLNWVCTICLGLYLG